MLLAHRDASVVETSRPSGATVARICVPRVALVVPADVLYGIDELVLEEEPGRLVL